jgi:hypothetical protein
MAMTGSSIIKKMNSNALTIDIIVVFILFMISSTQWISKNEAKWLNSVIFTLAGRRFIPIEV